MSNIKVPIDQLDPLPDGVEVANDTTFPVSIDIGGGVRRTLRLTAEQAAVFFGGSGGTPSDATPAALGTAAAGVATTYSRGDHVHQAPTPVGIGAATVAEVQTAQNTADGAANAATAAQGTADNAVTAAGIAQTTAEAAQDDATQALSDAAAAQTTANAALPKPGGTTTANGIAYGSGTAGAAVAVSTTTIADLTGATATAQTTATDALYPLVQTAHTSATKTLAAGDAGEDIPLNAASNAIEVTIPGSLFGTGGAGRMFVCTAKVLSVAGGALTFVGSSGITTIEYYGKDPAVDAYIAGDRITIIVDSATTASVFAVEAL